MGSSFPAYHVLTLCNTPLSSWLVCGSLNFTDLTTAEMSKKACCSWDVFLLIPNYDLLPVKKKQVKCKLLSVCTLPNILVLLCKKCFLHMSPRSTQTEAGWLHCECAGKITNLWLRYCMQQHCILHVSCDCCNVLLWNVLSAAQLLLQAFVFFTLEIDLKPIPLR